MLNNILLLVTFIVSSSFCYPRFHDDYKVSETKLGLLYEDYVNELLRVNEDIPKPCRTDLCYASRNKSETKGELMWPEITVSQKVELRCPFAFQVPVYSTRVCGISRDGKAEWEESDFQEICPDRPMKKYLKQFEKEAGKFKLELARRDDLNMLNEEKALYQSFLRNMSRILTHYREMPVFGEEVHDLLEHFINAISVLVIGSDGQMAMDEVMDILNIVDTFMDEEFKYHIRFHMDFITRMQIQFMFQELPYMIERPNDQPLVIIQSNFAIYLTNITKQTANRLDITDTFDGWRSNEHMYAPNVSLDLSGVNKTGVDLLVIILRDATAFDVENIWYPENDNTNTGYHYEFYRPPNYELVTNIDSSLEIGHYTDIPDGLFQLSSHTNTNFNVQTTHLSKTDPHEYHEAESSPEPDPAILSDDAYSDEEMGMPDGIPMYDNHPTPLSFRGSGIYLWSTQVFAIENTQLADAIVIIYEEYTCENRSICKSDATCMKAGIYDTYTIWSTRDCTTVDSQVEHGQIHCHCSGLGMFAIMTGIPDDQFNDTEDIVQVKQGAIASFVGFQYKRELGALGNVLGTISLACLIVTVLSYSTLRRTRQGTSTTILLNLCVALICLSVLLFSMYIVGDDITRNGCTVSNTLHYYLVFVTLLWNGIEAFNMYLTLVKVLNSNTSKFAVKAGVIAWGVPAIMVTACYFTDSKSFYGEHTVVSEFEGKCIFQCKLKENTLYYWYLAPMGVIILHNMVVFGFVLNAICKHGEQLGKFRKNMVKLVGSVVTLVLLGVPWIFSAFGGIPAKGKENITRTEGVYQVVFVVFVNIQGLFIFVFHCVRNVQVRESWFSLVRRSSQSVPGGVANISMAPSSHIAANTSLKDINETKYVEEHFDQL